MKKYNIQKLAELGGVTRRTIRFYIQQELLPKPLGTGRGSHYTQEHLDTLIEIKTSQECGKPLDQIKTEKLIFQGVNPPENKEVNFDLSGWIRITIDPEIELHLRRSRAPESQHLGTLVEEIRLLVATHLPDVNKRSK